MYNAGDYNTTETVNIPLNSFSSDDPTASVTITDLAAGDIEIHKDGSTTQRSSDSGVTVSINFDGVTGNHMIHIDLSDNTDAGFYSSGSRYLVRIEGVTVDSGTLNAWVGGFSIDCVLRPTTAGRTLTIESDGMAHTDVKEVGGVSQTGNDNGADINDILTDTNEIQGKLPTNNIMGSSDTDNHDTDIDSILADTNELQSDWANGGRLDLIIDAILVDTGTTLPAEHAALPTAAENRTEMDSNSTQLAAIVADTNELQTDDIPGLIAALNNISAADVNAQCDAAIETYHLDHLLAVDYDPASKPGVATALLNELVENDSGVSRFTSNALEQGPSGGATAAEVRTEMDANSTQLAAIVADTNEVQTKLFSAFDEVTSVPAAGGALASKIGFDHHAGVQKSTFTVSGDTGTLSIKRSDGSTELASRTIIDDGTTQTTNAVS